MFLKERDFQIYKLNINGIFLVHVSLCILSIQSKYYHWAEIIYVINFKFNINIQPYTYNQSCSTTDGSISINGKTLKMLVNQLEFIRLRPKNFITITH